MPNPKTMHSTSLAFNPEDVDNLNHIQYKTGMTKTEIVRRLVRALAAGVTVPGLPSVPALPAASEALNESLT